MSDVRVIAIDWSGAATGAKKKIWLAEVSAGRLIRLECGRTRGEIADHLIDEARRDAELVVGLDFAFSMPAWFFRERKLCDVRELWRLAAREGERWLSSCDPPFWGRPGRCQPLDIEMFRIGERVMPRIANIRAKSVFQIGGAGAVGTGSIRGMPMLEQLQAFGFSIWPFDEPGLPSVVEIYPRRLTGAVNKSNADARINHLQRYQHAIPIDLRKIAASCEDSFDASVSALVMWQRREELVRLGQASDAEELLEGAIWWPDSTRETAAVESP